MNKLMGFFELRDSSLPTIPWQEYTGTETLRPDLLWTVRSAVYRGADQNLPRKVGVKAEEAEIFAKGLRDRLKDAGMVIYYPYFIANKSGTLNVFRDRAIIEAVSRDLWNLVTYSDRAVTYEFSEKGITADGDRTFLSEEELTQITREIPTIRKNFRNELLEGKSILLEWSLAQNSNVNGRPEGEEFLVFYEMRTV